MKTVVFEGVSLETLRQFPDNARLRAGYEIDRVHRGMEPENWKPFPSIGKGVREIRIQIGRQFRVMYLVKFENKIHILHVFEKKSQKTRSTDIETAKKRLKTLLQRYR